MFDPTIYENLKVVVEGEIYEHDLDGDILITDRQDLVNLATMSRLYSVSFKDHAVDTFQATLMLEAQSEDLYGEILENEFKDNGCKLTLQLQGPINDIQNIPKDIQEQLDKKWNSRPVIQQEISFIWDAESSSNNFFTKITLNFDRKINEDHISDFTEIISLLIESLHLLNGIAKNT
ncbi:hypothetical protein BKP35_07265 [Anaerobacillus arseniciselenatis]|uniref:Group-specific protein n=1 Tax=Anaerobacillus arseniciselenatis TaxID=85682 RepID=A0A1S2LN90_9BACI|nr:hypothetical protein [Anaerobacillus arseniciselenatis]OIJ13998.1 hypothetical protein BKP35_07265 [Anaerobacillus arseniciselenatis]